MSHIDGMRRQSIRTVVTIGFFLFAVAVILAAGCGCTVAEHADSPAQADTPKLAYLSSARNELYLTDFSISGDTPQTQVNFCMQELLSEKAGSGYLPLIPSDVSLQKAVYDDHQVFLYFNKAYDSMRPDREILVRGGIVTTLMQIDEVSGVSFFVEGMPLLDASGKQAGIMTNETFAVSERDDNPVMQELTLYFADRSGRQLVREIRSVEADNSANICTLIIHELINGPQNSMLRRTIPKDTELNNVYLRDGICFVNFDSGILSTDGAVQEDVMLYSIVNSLTEVPEVKSVQISVNGNTRRVLQNELSLSEFYVRNMDLVGTELTAGD